MQRLCKMDNREVDMYNLKKPLKVISERIFDAKLRYRLLFLYFVGGVVPMILINTYLVRGTDRILVEEAKTAEVTEMEMAQHQVEELLDTVNMVSRYYLFNEQLEKIAFENYEDYQMMVNDYKNFTGFTDYGMFYNNKISWFSVYFENETIRGNSQFVKVDDTIRNQEWYQKIINKGGGLYWQYLPVSTNAYESLALTRLLKTIKGKNVGVLVLHIQPARLSEIIRDRKYGTMLILNGSSVVVQNAENEVEFEKIKEYLPAHQNDTYQEMIEVDGKKYVMTSAVVTLEESDDVLQLVSLRSRDDILKTVNQQNRESVFFFICSVVLSLVLISIFSWSFGRRVECFHNQMKKAAAGNFELEKELGGNDEISELYDYLGTMIWQIQKLLSEIYQEKLHAEQLKLEQKEAEFKMLASQINPHFLYNTLETIRMKARINKQYEIEELVKMLAKLLRKNIQAGSQEVTIQTEMELIACYLKIQQYRFGDRIQYEIQVDTQLSEYRILPLIIQPIVENSIVHGLEIKEGIGHIHISATRSEKGIRIIIEDDGVGMSEEKLDHIRRNLDRKNQDGSHIGICNVHQRIRLRYGDAYGIGISSEEGVGTSVEMILPVDAKEEERGMTNVQSDDH